MSNVICLKIQWAEHHFRQLYSVVGSFVSPNPYRVTVERDPQTREPIYRIANEVSVPPEIALGTSDVIHNLRTSLEHLACALVVANKGTVTTSTGFPIFKNMPTTPKEDAAFAGKIKGMSSDAVDRILSIEPYKGGDDVLWRLHALNNRDKHRLLCTVGASMGHWSITQHIDATDMPLSQMERLGRAYAASDFNNIMREGTFPLKKGQIIFVDAPDAKENPDFKFRPEVVINEPTICEGKPVISVLDASFRRVVEVVKMFDGLY